MLIFCAVLAIFVYGMIAAMLGTILPDLSDRFHLTPSQNGAIAFSQALGLMIASLAVGPLLDSEGDKIGLILGLACIALALFLLPRARSFGRIVALLFLLGVGGGIVVTGANALVSGVTLAVQCFTQMPAPAAASGFVLSQVGPILGRPLLLMLGLFLFLYVSCEVGVWNWLPRHLIARGIPEARALNILSLGFALGLLIGRVGASRILIHVPAIEVTLAASIAMAITTFLMLRTDKPVVAAALVFIAGLSMAPVFPTVLAITGTAFPHLTGTAIGFVITCGWAGLAVSSRLIGAIAGGDPLRLKKALLLIPAFAVMMVILNLGIWSTMK